MNDKREDKRVKSGVD